MLGLFLYIYIKHAWVSSVFVNVHISTLMAASVWHRYWRSTVDHYAGNLWRSPERGGTGRCRQIGFVGASISLNRPSMSYEWGEK